MISFDQLSITRKLKIVIMLTCMAAILIASVSSMVQSYLNYRRGLINDLEGLADILSQNSSVALAFGIPEDAEKTLSVLQNRSSIAYAFLYDAKGQYFASYPAGVRLENPEGLPLELGRRWFDQNSLNLVHPVLAKGKRIGTLILKDDLSSIQKPIQRTILINLLVMLVALAVAYILASRLQNLITRPVLSLARTAEQVSQRKDFSIRAVKEHQDEIGTLIDAFNEMLVQIQHSAQTLRESEQRFRALIEKAPVAIGMARNNRFIYANPKYLEMCGFTDANELVGQPIFDWVAPQDREVFQQRSWNRELGLPTESNYEAWFLRKDGSQFCVLAAATRVELADGPASIVFINDITESKLAEQRRLQLEAQLRQAQKMESIGTLAGGIAHDFNNILSALYGYAELALIKAPPFEKEIRHFLEQILKAAERARDLVKQILIFSRHRDQELKPIQVNLILNEALKLLRATIPTTIEIHKEIPSDPLSIMGDPTQIHQVIINLCTNAAYAMRDSKGEIFVKLSNEFIDDSFEAKWEGIQPGHYLELTVRDTGEGIEEEVLKRIFEPFFTTKPVGQGTGLGLSVVDGIVRNHNGAIRVTSKVGVGTTFVVYLPLLPSSEGEKAGAVDLPYTRGDGEHILVVDDEPDIANVTKTILNLLGYNSQAVTSSREALRLFRENPNFYSLLITDQTMPELTGLDLIQEIIKLRPGLPTIICTGYSEHISEAVVRSQGIHNLLFKPLTYAVLAESTAKALGKKSRQ